MIPDLDIYRAARVLVKQHGEDAPIHAAMRADAMLEAGDLGGLAVWKRILRAVEELQGASLARGCIEARSRGWIFLMYRNSNVRSWGPCPRDRDRGTA